ncbi:fascin-3 isoform X3 [Peromyscus eremicus]|uniref:fascin-3 isoform X3 n=1 Tax=Peromyscus eremicus TaxID=42410 RepID=UPI0027DB51C7|nr:fascin-3 isoform X3 [Peromyscus eremicus]
MAEVEWIHRHPKTEDLRVGLISWAGTYLTFEAFKSTVTATAKSLCRRQTWELLVSNEHDAQAVVRLKNLQGLYLLCEADGTVCYGRPRTSHHGCFLLRFHRNGKWTLQCIISGRYLESDDRLVPQRSSQTAFYMQVRPRGLVALCDGEGGTLYPQGTHLLLGLGSNPTRGEEWFILQHFPTWVSLRSRTRRFISVMYDAEVCAASERLTPMSLFQYECDNESLTLQLRSANGYYLAQRRHKSIIADGHPLESDTFFRVHWNCGKIMLQSSNGRFLSIISNGLLMANATIPGPNEELGIRFANRPFLILRGRYGYVGSCSDHDLMQCNRDQPDCIHLLPCRQGIYHFQGWILLVNNIFWHLPPLGKIRPQLLYRTSGEQLAHGAGAQWLLHPSRPKWNTLGRQRRHYQRMYLGILGQWDAACQTLNLPGLQEQNRRPRVKIQEKNMCCTIFPTEFSETPVSRDNTSQQATPRSVSELLWTPQL